MVLNNLNGGAMSQKLSLNNLKEVNDICKSDESIIKIYNNVFLNSIFNTQEINITFTTTYHFYL